MSTLRAFSYGEISPSLQKRVDLDSYARSAGKLRNWKVKREGGIETRPGSIMSAPVKYSTDDTKNVVVREFIFNSAAGNTYAIEVGHQYMRFHKGGEQIRTAGATITGVTAATEGVVTYSGTDPANGDEIYISGIKGMIEMNGRWGIVGSLNTGAKTFKLTDRDGNALNTSLFTAYSSGGTFEKVYEISTSYDNGDIYSLSFAQLNDVVVIAHGDYAPATLTRTADASWALASITFGPSASRVTDHVVNSYTAAGANQYTYKVTSIDATTNQESTAGTGTVGASISAITRANPGEVTTGTDHLLLTGDQVTFSSVGGMTQLNGNTYTITKVSDTKFTLGVDSSAYTAWTAGGTMTIGFVRTAPDATAPALTTPVELRWTPVSNSRQYVVYKSVNGIYSFLGVAENNASATYIYFDDKGAVPDDADTLMIQPTIYNSSGEYPTCVAFGRQRLIFGGSTNHPNRIRPSRRGDYFNFGYHETNQADDGMSLDIVGDRAQIVLGLKEVSGRVIAFCSEGEFGIGSDDGTIDATAPFAQQFSGHGSTSVRPLLISNIATFVQARSSQVRDLGFAFSDNTYKGEERSIRSSHLFKGHSISDWCYQQVPDSTVWAVRDDGVLLGCTYVREEQMAAWHRHDMHIAKVKSVCAIPGSGGEDVVYMVVARYDRVTQSGPTITVEYFDSRFLDENHNSIATPQTYGDVVNHCFVDGGILYDGRHNDDGTHVSLSGGSTWAAGESLTLTCSAARFDSTMVGDMIFLHGVESYNLADSLVKCTITAYTSTTVLTVQPDRAVPTALQGGNVYYWDHAKDYIDGLHHLEDQHISVMGDGFVEASPYNDSYSTLTVIYGVVSLAHHAAVIWAGMPFLCDMEPLDIDSMQVPGGGLIQRKKVVNRLYIAVEQTRGLFVGPEAPSDDDDDATENLEPVQRRANDFTYDEPAELETVTNEQDSIAQWNSYGRFFIRQVDPIPATVLAIYPEGTTFA